MTFMPLACKRAFTARNNRGLTVNTVMDHLRIYVMAEICNFAQRCFFN